MKIILFIFLLLLCYPHNTSFSPDPLDKNFDVNTKKISRVKKKIDDILFLTSDLDILAWALYHEARGEGKMGMARVGRVILNRVDSKRFPNSIRGVVYQRKQFSFIDEAADLRMTDYNSRKKAYQVASDLLLGKYVGLVGGADHYYAHRQLTPSWANSMRFCNVYKNHTFCGS